MSLRNERETDKAVLRVFFFLREGERYKSIYTYISIYIYIYIRYIYIYDIYIHCHVSTLPACSEHLPDSPEPHSEQGLSPAAQQQRETLLDPYPL